MIYQKHKQRPKPQTSIYRVSRKSWNKEEKKIQDGILYQKQYIC